ncbi:hypothetical protein SARC_04628 [Sphaeroforma arctica JP610]|uniref:Uncharacterized protein n=1 Tax=Sphaeroforma arctica JP610 TaxID=667725 RepID=A0A0L0G2N7_9EUKA|nr:hypothetical protein SARC_04628 [Sphaeroforma arctica JP610]KNC83109.1 hypothetical protein SARC_04628 [Sphaeroforma arctica JP610]|eukprot:XP_014157011.1 hypothetical protein SARC_04628 [Sphaeroforma arctica JP610]
MTKMIVTGFSSINEQRLPLYEGSTLRSSYPRLFTTPFSVYFGRRHVPFANLTDDFPGHISTTNDAWLNQLDELEKTILPKLHQKTIKYTGAMVEATDQMRKFNLLEFKTEVVVMILAETSSQVLTFIGQVPPASQELKSETEGT